MKIRTNRQASPEEAAAMLEDMDTRTRTGAEIRVSLAKHFTPDKIAALIAGMPEDSQARIFRECLTEPPVRRTIKITTRKPSTKKARQ